jgi:hypothetical protein
MRSSHLGTWMVLAALVGHSARLPAHVVLTFQVSSHTEPAPSQPQKATDETFPLLVTLGHQFLSTEAKGTRTIYDFERNRIRRLDLQNRTFVDDSLYTDIAFRVLEFHNRMVLGKALRAANVKGASFDNVALVENLFSLLDDDSNSLIDPVRIGAGTEYRSEKQTLLSVSDRVLDLPADYRSEYWRFFRYYAGGHPKILASLLPLKGVPEKTTIVLSNMKIETRTMTLQKLAMTADTPYSLEGFTLTMPDREPYTTLKLLSADAPHELQARVAAALQDRDSAYAKGKYLDAYLASIEIYLSTGQMDTEWLRAASTQINADAQVLKVGRALGKHEPSESPRIADDLAAVRSLAPAHVDVVDIFEGNTRLGISDQGKQGEELLLTALRADPYITGAWHDLADRYYRTFRMQEAWSCMDAARRIAPNHPMLKSIDGLEQALRSRNPGYF